MEPRYILHYAPDNASLVIRLALEEMALPYDTTLVDRRAQAQDGPAYRALNPNGLIPVLETPDGPVFETAAILLWLADQHGAMAPAAESSDRAGFLKWLFFASNTLHADLRILFYAKKYIGDDPSHQSALRAGICERLKTYLKNLDAACGTPWLGGEDLSVLDIYLACQLRWMRLYPATYDRSWFELDHYPALRSICAKLETRASAQTALIAEGLGPQPFTNPSYANPPEGSAT
ncbi:MAG: glutathione S-transferase [Rhodobacteraceae bacterium]|nr:glutathione S-transferase [Paracoccaceae bacterium]